MFVPLQKLLPRSIKKAGLVRQVEAALVCQSFEKVIWELLGEKALGRAKPLHLKNKVLTVACLSSAEASELRLKEKEILTRLNREFRGGVVKRLRFLL